MQQSISIGSIVKRIISFPLVVLRVLFRILERVFGILSMFAGFPAGKLCFNPRADDVYIVTYPRSGTTWTQMILYQLISDGDMETISHISQKVPWLERTYTSGRNLDKLPAPHIIKTHYPWRKVPKPGRYIYVERDGRDVAVSFYYFMKGITNFRGDFNVFFERFMSGKVLYGSWFKHVADWRAQRDNPNVLYIKYEELKEDLEGALRKILAFLGREVDESRFPEILERCSFQYMKQHEIKFDQRIGLMLEKSGAYHRATSFIRKGKSGGWRGYFNEEQIRRYHEALEENHLVEPKQANDHSN